MGCYPIEFGMSGAVGQGGHPRNFYILDGIAYDNFDAGNFLWGMAMRFLNVPYAFVKAGSELNAVLWSKDQNKIHYKNWLDSFEWSGDAARDQRAIRRGYHHPLHD